MLILLKYLFISSIYPIPTFLQRGGNKIPHVCGDDFKKVLALLSFNLSNPFKKNSTY